MLAAVPGTVKNNIHDNGHSCFIPDFNEKLRLCKMLVCRGQMLSRLSKCPCVPVLSRILKNQEWKLKLSKCLFRVREDDRMFFFLLSFNRNNDRDSLHFNYPCIPGWIPLGHGKYFNILPYWLCYFMSEFCFHFISEITLQVFGTLFVGFHSQCACLTERMEAFVVFCAFWQFK